MYFNQKINLVSRNTQTHADQIHFADCLIGSQLILKSVEVDGFYDLGSGNGFPGLIMALLAPDKKIVLVDRNRKKVEFLKGCVLRLELKNVQVWHSQIEELKDHVPYVVSRGLAPIHQLIPLLEKIGCKKSYHFKSQNWQTEFQQITPPWSFGTVGKYILPQDNKKEGAKLVIIFLNREHT